ncbi:MAG: 2-oxoglutarate dehydrogenase E1 component, partial [Casimicrobiaceae bacterium]
MSMLEEFRGTSTLFGGNMPFIEEQYERYLADPASVTESWRAYFDKIRDGAADVAHAPVIESFIQVGRDRKAAVRLVDEGYAEKQSNVALMEWRYRVVGNRAADVDPLGRAEVPYLP